MLSLVSTWMGDRLGTLGAVGTNLFLVLRTLIYRVGLLLRMKIDRYYI